ncbi:TonB-dependent siderophore receptor [Kushneria aurantia]|uniref:TonB-dependent siderophore receptor n=1 Tax=Kushneria aurantia TaxID=504092 RepID=A0ABV6G0G7_9GAMM|nr:TonB-dependent siderophore receptor [Kushneria aurantia]
MRIRIASVALLPNLLLAPMALADAGTSELETMTVVADRPQESRYLPAPTRIATGQQIDFLDSARSVEQLSRQQIDDSGANSLTEALQWLPGITLSNTMGGTEAGFIKRGFGSNSDGSILRDGIRQPRNTFPLFTAERIEVLKGPSSFRYGIQEPGGVVNIVSKKPRYQPQRLISGEGSSFGGGRTSIDVTGPLGDSGTAYRVIVGRQNEDYWRNFGENRQTVIAPSLAWQDEDTRLWLAYEYRDYDLTLDRGTAFVDGDPLDLPRKRRLDEDWSRVTGHDQAVTASWEQDLDADWSSRLVYGWNRRQYDDGQPRVLSVDEDGLLTRRADANLGFDRRVIYTAGELLGDVELAGLRHELTLGADHERRRDYLADRYRGETDRQSIDNLDYGRLEPPRGADHYLDSRSHRLDELHNSALYFDDRIHFGERWILGLGGRYQYSEQYGIEGVQPVIQADIDDTYFLPHANLLYRLDAMTSVYASYSESFVPNEPDSDSGQRFDPEEGRGWEVGLKRRLLDDRLAASLVYFDIDKDNIVVSDNGVARAIGSSGSRGVELSLEGELSDRLSLLANYAWTDAEVKSDGDSGLVGNELPNVARHTAALLLARELAVDPASGLWRVGGGVRYVGEREGDADNSFTLDDYSVVDAFARWTPPGWDERSGFELRVDNLFDITWYTASGGDTRVMIGEPLAVRLSASLSF